MSEIEFEVGGRRYRASKMPAMQQFHVSRKIAPLLPALIPVFVNIAKKGGVGEDFGALTTLLQPLADGLANLKDEDADFVVGTCLSTVKRENAQGSFTPIWSMAAKTLMSDDMTLADMIPIVVRVIQDQLGPFIQGFLTSNSSKEAAPQ